MKFRYNYYRKTLLLVPLFVIAFVLATLFILSMNIFTGNNFSKFNLSKIIILLCLLICLSEFFIDSIGHLKYGIFLLTQKSSNSLKTTGEIEKIIELKNPFVHNYKYARRDYETKNSNAHLITISGKQYYFMIKGDLQVGEYVEIKYLPKSTIVLEVKIIETE